MPEFVKFLTQMREQMNAELTRSDVLRPMIWPNAGLMTLLPTSIFVGAPEWITHSLLTLLIVFLCLYAIAYIFFAITYSDALRSEKYKLHKMAIERGLYGDSGTGLKSIEDISANDTLIEAHPVVSLTND